MRNARLWFNDMFLNLAHPLLSEAKRLLGIKSPSRVVYGRLYDKMEDRMGFAFWAPVRWFSDRWLKWQERQVAYLLYDLEGYEKEIVEQAKKGIPPMPPATGMYPHLSTVQAGIVAENREMARDIYDRVRIEYPVNRRGITFPDTTPGANPFLKRGSSPDRNDAFTVQERAILDQLAAAYSGFVELDVMHDWHQREFMLAIHQAQRLVLARPGLRALNKRMATLMSDFVFTPSAEQTAVSIPFYEDAEASAAPYYSSTKTVRQAKTEVTEELVKLGAGILAFQEGHFGQRPRKRYGYQIQFNYRGAVGVIRVAGLPVAQRDVAKVERVRVQALLNVRDWLKAGVTQAVFSLGSNPLMMNLLVDGRHTLAEYIQERGALQIPAVSDNNVVDGEFVE